MTSLASDRLNFRGFTDADATELHEIFSNPKTHTIGDGPINDLALTRDWIARRRLRFAEHGVAWYAVHARGHARLAGSAGLFMGRTDPHPEFGFEIRHALQGLGYGREAAAAVLAEAHRAGFSEVWATVREWNIASLRVLRRLGFEQDRIVDQNGPLIYLRHEDGGPVSRSA